MTLAQYWHALSDVDWHVLPNVDWANTVVTDEGITALAQTWHALSNVNRHVRSNVNWANKEVTDADKAAVELMVAGRWSTTSLSPTRLPPTTSSPTRFGIQIPLRIRDYWGIL